MGSRVLLFMVTLLAGATLGTGLLGSTITVGDGCGIPGDTISVPVTVDLDEDILGFSFGIAFDGSLVEADSVLEGSDVEALNDGDGPTFFASTILDDGVTVGCVFELEDAVYMEASDESYEVAELILSPLADLADSDGAALEFTDELQISDDAPPVLTIFSDGTTITPDQVNGLVELCVPDVDVTCEVTDICTCEVTLSWTAGNWDSIWIGVGDNDPVEVEGDATSYVVILESTGDYEFNVFGSFAGIDGDTTICEVTCDEPEPGDCGTEFLRGDVDSSGNVSALLDALALLNWQFLDGDEPTCKDAADIDDSGSVSALLDSLFLLNWQFLDGDDPPAPGTVDCGLDETEDTGGEDLGCEESGC